MAQLRSLSHGVILKVMRPAYMQVSYFLNKTYCTLQVGCHKETDSVHPVAINYHWTFVGLKDIDRLHDGYCLFPCDNLHAKRR